MKIVTHYDPKPIPIRDFDWIAVTDDYDGASRDPIGYGRTEAAAIANLQESIVDRDFDYQNFDVRR